MPSEISSRGMRSIYWIALSLVATVTTGLVVDRTAVAETRAIEVAVPVPTVQNEPQAHAALRELARVSRS